MIVYEMILFWAKFVEWSSNNKLFERDNLCNNGQWNKYKYIVHIYLEINIKNYMDLIFFSKFLE